MIADTQIIVPTLYFPPVSFFYLLNKTEKVFIEQYENYSKQSYRNRCEILSPNGKLTLSIPVKKKSGEKQLIKDIKIDYKNDWQKQHLKSIETAYFSSPFYEFYIDAFLTFFSKKYTFLFDYNYEILKTLLSELQIDKDIKFTSEYIKDYGLSDYRAALHPKKKIPKFNPKAYTQVFFDKFPFTPNLSILDLLFNEGPNFDNFL